MIFLEGAKDHYFKGTSQLMHINFWEVATWRVCLLQEISCSHFTGAVGSLRAPRILIGLSGSDQPQVGLPPTFSAQRPGLWALSCVAGHEPSWSRPWPTDCLPGLTSCLPCHCGPAWLSLDLILTPSCRFTSQLGFKPPPSLMILPLGQAWLPSPGLSCSPHLGAVSGHQLARPLPCHPWGPTSAPMSLRELLALTVP